MRDVRGKKNKNKTLNITLGAQDNVLMSKANF